MQLELKHLAAYLPYSVVTDTGTLTCSIINRREKNNTLQLIKMHLRPLSDLTKEIALNGEKFVPAKQLFKDFLNVEITDFKPFETTLAVTCQLSEDADFFTEFIVYQNSFEDIKHWIVAKLHEWHFDTFGLIDAGLALDINKLNQQS